jgi:hypothetical protein
MLASCIKQGGNFCQASDVGPRCAPIIWAMRMTTLTELLRRQEAHGDEALPEPVRQEVLQHVERTKGCTPFVSVHNLRNLTATIAQGQSDMPRLIWGQDNRSIIIDSQTITVDMIR